MGAATLLALVGEFKLVKTKKRCCKSKPRCKKCPVVCKRLEAEGFAIRQDRRSYLVELGIGKKTLKAARAR
jgi:aldehyde:ferredoxin oxidoreductase